MKLLFDHNLAPRLVSLLADLFPGSSHVYILGLDRADDRAVWDYAHQHGFCIVTKDADFGDLSTLLGSPPKVIWLRLGNCKTVDIESALRQHIADIRALEEETAGVLALF